MAKKTISKKEIDNLYKRIGLADVQEMPSNVLNTGTMHNKLAGRFDGGKPSSSLQGKTIKGRK
ncbi:MAG: hypothetical protein PUC26_02670 [Eubacteriales bacterium]|nr:hypothetical protein [Eubacteriales bacterium]